MTFKINGWLTFLAIYAVASFGTFGWIWNHSKGDDRCYVDNGVQHDCFTDNSGRAKSSIISGVFWPIFWGGKTAIDLTKSN